MLDEKKKIVNLQILDVVVSLMIADKDEETVRNAVRKLNDRANDIKDKNPSFESLSILAYLALDECMENMNKNRNKTDGFLKRTVQSFAEKMNALFIDE